METFLSDRKLRVGVDGIFSDNSQFNVSSEVPQGCVLSPTLFIIFIEDLRKLIESPIRSYEDDTTLLSSHRLPRGCSRNQVQAGLICYLNKYRYLGLIIQWGGRGPI